MWKSHKNYYFDGTNCYVLQRNGFTYNHNVYNWVKVDFPERYMQYSHPVNTEIQIHRQLCKLEEAGFPEEGFFFREQHLDTNFMVSGLN
jgi:hypothetical protein